MRRKDREMDKVFALALIDKSPYGVLSVIDTDGSPYGVPLSIVRKENCLYFHSAKGGKKVDAFSTHKTVAVTFVGATKVPELFSDKDLKDFLIDEKKAATLTSKVFTTQYESAMVFGKICLVENTEEAIDALRLLCEKYTPSKMDYFDLAINSGLSKTNIYKIEIDEISAKRKKFDSSGEEMKWGRI